MCASGTITSIYNFVSTTQSRLFYIERRSYTSGLVVIAIMDLALKAKNCLMQYAQTIQGIKICLEILLLRVSVQQNKIIYM